MCWGRVKGVRWCPPRAFISFQLMLLPSVSHHCPQRSVHQGVAKMAPSNSFGSTSTLKPSLPYTLAGIIWADLSIMASMNSNTLSMCMCAFPEERTQWVNPSEPSFISTLKLFRLWTVRLLSSRLPSSLPWAVGLECFFAFWPIGCVFCPRPRVSQSLPQGATGCFAVSKTDF